MAKLQAVRRLLSGLGQEYHDYRPSLQIFPELNPSRIAVELKLEATAAERAARGEPPTNSTNFDDVEMQIVDRVEAARHQALDTLAEQMQVYSQRLASLDFEERFTAIRLAAPAAVSEFRAEGVKGRDELFSLCRALRDHEAERDEFRTGHRLKRVARQATGGNLMLKIGILVFLTVIEVVVNGAFLAKGSDQGLLGGMIEAVTFATLNVLVSFGIAAIGVRRLNHRNVLWKIMGLLSLIFYFAFAIGLNLVLAHYREVAGTFAEEAGREVLARIIADPIGLMDLKSWLFLAVGLTFSAIAFIDAFLIYDPYPGYGELQKRVDEAHADYRFRKENLIENLVEIRDEAVESLERANRDLSTRRGEYDTILEGSARLKTLFLSQQDHLERTANTLLSIYREANSRFRVAASVPNRFSTYRMERMPMQIDLTENTAREDLRKSIAAAQALLLQKVEAIHAEFESALRSYKEIEEMIQGGQDGAQKLKVA